MKKTLLTPGIAALALAASFVLGCGSAALKPMPDGGDGPAGGSSGGSSTAGSGGRGGQGGSATAGTAGGGTGGSAAGSGGVAGTGGGTAGTGGSGATAGTGGATAGTGGATAGTGGSTAGGGGAGRGGTGGTAGGTAGVGGRGGTAGSGACTDECCTNADCGACQICTAAHTCTAAKNQDDPVAGRCAGTCDANGACKSKKGQSCTATAGGCISGAICAPDGYCCNASCGTDATCAGTCANRTDGSCTYPAGMCGTATCSGTDIINRGNCANGACQMPAAAACTGGFICAANACKTSCTSASDCLSTNYCDAGSCVAKKASGQVCSNAGQCTSGVCGGRCCNTGVACNCPVQSPTNLIQNGGFDMDAQLTGWTVATGGTGSVTWQANDPTSCPYSGSAHIDNAGGAIDSVKLAQCVSVARATTYNFGVTMQSSAGYVHCAVDIYPSANCQGVGINVLDDVWLNVSWSIDMATTVDTGNMTSLRVACWAEAGVALNFDGVYLTPPPGKF